MGYGILAKDPEAQSVDGLSIWAQNQNTLMSIANDDGRNKQSCIHFFAIMFYFEPIKKHFSQTCPWKRLVFFA